MDVQEIENRLTSLEVRMSNVEAIVKEIKTISETLVKINVNITDLGDKFDKMDERVSEIELAPANAWNNAKTTFFTAIISALGGAVASGLIILLAQSL